MKALVLEDIGKLEYKDVPKPSPGKGEVLVAVKACGICGSDIPRAYREGAHNMPLIIGHEFSGCVEQTGDGVSSGLIGKRVGIFPLIPCGKCLPCQSGRYEMCRDYDYLGSRCNGGFAEYVTVPEWNLIELPEEVTYEEAAMLEPMAVACHSARTVLPLLPGSQEPAISRPVIAVCGLGTIGTLLVMLLSDAGYKELIVIGNKQFQKETVTGLGIIEEYYCDSSKEDSYDFIMKKTNGKGADIFFECVGSSAVASLAVSAAAPGGSVCFVGNPRSDMTFEKQVYWKILRNQLKIFGTWNSSFSGNRDNPDDDWHYVISRLERGCIDPAKLITHRFSPEDILSGFELMRDRKEDYIKVICTTA
ncbi:MAG: galactitol-1-phosphate 5-dehydrogenase [Lachnospiraceae bacterium]|nr:galactitol-1-phosphate 5-dehydrogenase [Lachnospiraceae bacterium]